MTVSGDVSKGNLFSIISTLLTGVGMFIAGVMAFGDIRGSLRVHDQQLIEIYGRLEAGRLDHDLLTAISADLRALRKELEAQAKPGSRP